MAAPHIAGRRQHALGALALAAALFAACAKSSGGGGTGTGGDMGGGTGGDTGGLKLATGGPYPFPQHRASGSCALTTAVSDDAANTAAQAAYNSWRAAFVTSNGAAGHLRVQRTNNQNDTVSEGIGYGMIAAVYMNDRATFDGLWQYGQSHFNSKGLMSWHLTASGALFAPNDPGSASDGDVDMIWALIMASDQWSSNDYLNAAGNMIQAMRQNSIGPDGTLKPGDTWGATPLTNPSYFSPAYLRVFAIVANDPLWATTILDKNYATLARVAGANGLVPDWTNNSGVVNTTLMEGNSTFNNSSYGYDAARTPWRIAMDWCFNGEVRARDYLMKIGAFFDGVGASNIGDGYSLTGSPTTGNKNMAFIGPAGVSGMAGFPTLLNGAFNYGIGNGGDQSYYPSSLRMISMLMMSGNFVDFTK
jgi:endo-1,4-beta-D-glucanase Y